MFRILSAKDYLFNFSHKQIFSFEAILFSADIKKLFKFDRLFELRRDDAPAEFVVDVSGHRRRRIGFAVGCENCARRSVSKRFEPAQNGLFADWPQRHRATLSLPGGTAKTLP